MKRNFKYDFEKRVIIGSNAAIKKANAGEGKEYNELCSMLAAHPTFKVVPKEIDENENKKTYFGLTFKRMKEYILTQPDSENKLVLFEKVKEVAEAKGAKYPLTKKWFLKTYPEYKENEASVAESEAEMNKQAEAEVKALIDEENEEIAA